MNTDKLLKAIQILIREEIKLQLPKIVKQIQESNTKHSPKKSAESLEMIDILSEDNILEEMDDDVTPQKKFTNDPMINKILNETAKSYKGAPVETGYEDWKTVDGNKILSGAANGNPTVDRASMAAKLGYGDLATGPSSQGLGVKTGLSGLDRILNRDNRELVRAMMKKRE
jgi:hypothetical protein